MADSCETRATSRGLEYEWLGLQQYSKALTHAHLNMLGQRPDLAASGLAQVDQDQCMLIRNCCMTLL